MPRGHGGSGGSGVARSVGRAVAVHPNLRSCFLDIRRSLSAVGGPAEATDAGEGAAHPDLVRLGSGLQSSPRLVERVLCLGDNALGWRSVVGVLRCLRAPRLERFTVDLSGNPIGDAGVLALVSHVHRHADGAGPPSPRRMLQKLRLGLSHVGMGPRGLQSLEGLV